MGNVTVTLDTARIRRRFSAGKLRAERMLADQIIADSRPIVPKEEGTLRDLVRIEQGDESTSVIWDSPYAAYQYYGCWPDGTHQIRNHTTPGTSTMWVEKAKQRHGNDWQAVAQNAFKEGMG